MRVCVGRTFGLLAGLLLVAIGASPAGAQTITVTDCTAAGVQNAMSTVPNNGTIELACGSPVAPVTITVAATLQQNGVNFTLDGKGSVILAGNGAIGGPILQFDNQTAALRNLTVTGADARAIVILGGSTVTLTNMTIFNNVNAGLGGALEVDRSVVTIANSTFAGNSAALRGNDIEDEIPTGVPSDTGAVNVQNSILLDGCFTLGPPINDLGGNVASDGSCGSTNGVNGSIVGVTAGATLGPLSEGLYFLPAPGSAALGLDTANCPATDELGNPRGSTCNAGAIEAVAHSPIPVTTLGPGALALSALLLGGLGLGTLRQRA